MRDKPAHTLQRGEVFIPTCARIQIRNVVTMVRRPLAQVGPVPPTRGHLAGVLANLGQCRAVKTVGGPPARRSDVGFQAVGQPATLPQTAGTMNRQRPEPKAVTACSNEGSNPDHPIWGAPVWPLCLLVFHSGTPGGVSWAVPSPCCGRIRGPFPPRKSPRCHPAAL